MLRSVNKRVSRVSRGILAVMISILILGTVFPANALSYDELLRKAEEYINSGDNKKAFACYDLAQRTDSSNPTAFVLAGLLYLDMGNSREANEYAVKALAVDATSAEAWRLKCLIDLMNEDAAAFETDALYAEICGADLSEHAAEIGELYAKSCYWEKAAAVFLTVPVASLNEVQREYFRRSLINTGKKEMAADLGLEAGHRHVEKLDAAFASGYPKLTETDSSCLKLSASDFVISDEAIDMLRNAGVTEDVEAALNIALKETIFHPISRSPAGNSGIIEGGGTAIAEFNGKYRLFYPSAERSAADAYSVLQQYYMDFFFNRNNILNLIGDQGIAYSADGRFAAVNNITGVFQRSSFSGNPILLDLSTGELIITAAYDRQTEAVTTAAFSSDSRFFYYVTCCSGNTRTRLYRYNLKTGSTELCLETEKNLYYPQLSELTDGSLLMLNDAVGSGEISGFFVASCHEGRWSLKEYNLSLNRSYCYGKRYFYSPDSGYLCLLETTGQNMSVAFQIIRPENNFDGLDRVFCVSPDQDELLCFSADEFRTLIDNSAKEKDVSYAQSCQAILNALFSPDGSYLLLRTNNSKLPDRSINYYLIHLEDMSLRKVQGVTETVSAKIRMEWNTDEVMIRKNSEVHTYSFAEGSPEDSMPPQLTEEQRQINQLKEEIERQKVKVESAETQLQRWIAGGKKSETDIAKLKDKVQREKEKLQELEEELRKLEEASGI